VVERHVDQPGDGHAPQGGDAGEERLAEAAELALEELALDLHPHQQEEERHQPVVDHGAEVGVKAPASDRDLDRGLPQPEERRGPGGVGEGEGNQRRGEEDDAAGGLQPGKGLQRVQHHRPEQRRRRSVGGLGHRARGT
jgi:hypothetical protein